MSQRSTVITHFPNSQCFCLDRCNCAANPPFSPSSSPGSEYLNHRRWSQESSSSKRQHFRSNLILPQQAGASSPPTPLNRSPCITPTISRKGSKDSWGQGAEKGDDICIVVTDADTRPNPWGSSEIEQEGASWMSNFTAITTKQEPKEKGSPRKTPSSPGWKTFNADVLSAYFLMRFRLSS